MIGPIIGDIAGSRFEWNNCRSKEFELFTGECFATDDSIMSLAVCQALLESEGDPDTLARQAVSRMRELGNLYPGAGYGGRFAEWLVQPNPQPYNSFGNGSAMRVGGCAYAGKTLDEVKALSAAVTAVTPNHPEGIKGAEATAVAQFLAISGKSLAEIREAVTREYYPLDFTLDEIRSSYRFNETCQETVPQALEAFFESTSFEDAIRCAISVGGDSDTLAAITGAVAEAYYGVPAAIRGKAESFLDERQLKILRDFEARYPGKAEI